MATRSSWGFDSLAFQNTGRGWVFSFFSSVSSNPFSLLLSPLTWASFTIYYEGACVCPDSWRPLCCFLRYYNQLSLYISICMCVHACSGVGGMYTGSVVSLHCHSSRAETGLLTVSSGSLMRLVWQQMCPRNLPTSVFPGWHVCATRLTFVKHCGCWGWRLTILLA